MQVNNTNSGQFTIESGARGLDQLGLIREWNGEAKVNYWNDTYCDMINGIEIYIIVVAERVHQNIFSQSQHKVPTELFSLR